QHVICTAEVIDDNEDFTRVLLSGWQQVLAIELQGRSFNFEDFEALPECKLELLGGVIYGDVATRDAMLAALLSNIGLKQVVGFAPAALWRQALEASEGPPS